jgi:cytochrome c556
MIRMRTAFLLAGALSLLTPAIRAEEGAGTMSQGAGDTRKPLFLPMMMAEHQKQNMRDHLAAVQAIVDALARDDMDGVAKAAARMGYSEAMGQMCEHMGAATPGFTAIALSFHHTADAIGEAARRGDRQAVLTALDRTLQTCVACHATYRQEIVDEATWKRLVAEATGAH